MDNLSMSEIAELAALTLYGNLKDAETGSNEAGPYWNTAKMVEAIRKFYRSMESI